MKNVDQSALLTRIRWSRVAAVGTLAVLLSPILIIYELVALVLLLVALFFVRDDSRDWIGDVCIGLSAAVLPYFLLFGLVSLLG